MRLRLFIMLLCIIILVSCANPYRTNFASIQQMRLSNYQPDFIALQKGAMPEIYSTDDMYATKELMFENGYILLGSSRFNSKKLDDRKATAAAKNLGATVVVIQSKYLTSKTESVPFTTYTPDRRTRVEDTRYDGDGKVTSSRERRITVEGEFQTVYVQQTSDYYDYYATFWAKLRNFTMGLFVADLTDEERRQFQTNRGVSVKIVVKNTPAFNADIFKGDILMEFNGERINERRHYFRLVSENVGNEVTLSGYRDGKPFTVKVQL
jgi:C-terminal processing protease CtpA/Prc